MRGMGRCMAEDKGERGCRRQIDRSVRLVLYEPNEATSTPNTAVYRYAYVRKGRVFHVTSS